MPLKALGKIPSGDELEKVQASPQYKKDHFENIEVTKMMDKNSSMISVLWKFFNKPKTAYPQKPLPSVKTDLKKLPDDAPVIVWFGHSSYLIKLNGVHILVDPVFSGHASPFSSFAKAFKGTDVYTTDDLPDIDVLLITHDHYDHLDYITIKNLAHKIKLVYTSLGVASHLRYWGIDDKKIVELDWWDNHMLPNNIQLTAVPARHFSGRDLARDKTLWSAFVLHTSDYCLYVGGDSGYGNHFKAIHEKFNHFDIALLECGQYNVAWHDIHMLPEETAQACLDLNAKVLMPVHWGKFSLSLHPWNEPIKRLLPKAKELNIQVTTPLIGEPVIIGKSYPQKEWWNF